MGATEEAVAAATINTVEEAASARTTRITAAEVAEAETATAAKATEETVLTKEADEEHPEEVDQHHHTPDGQEAWHAPATQEPQLLSDWRGPLPVTQVVRDPQPAEVQRV